MTENLKKFLEAVSKNDELRAKASSMTKEDLLVLAKELGIELTDADFAEPVGEMNDNELDAVAGGGECYCVLGGGGTKNEKNGICSCDVYGTGTHRDMWANSRCYCIGYGSGAEGSV